MSVCRRVLVMSALAVAVLTVAGAPASARTARSAPVTAPAPAGTYSHVAVDVSVLQARGMGPFAAFVGRSLFQQLQKAFGDRLGYKDAPAIVVRVTGMSLPSYVDAGGANNGRWGGGATFDYLEGETLVVDRSGAILARYPILANLPSSYAGAWYDPNIDQMRVNALAGAYAEWSRRYVAGR